MLAAHPLHTFALHAAEVADVASAVSFRVRVDYLPVESRTRHSQAIIVPDDWRSVHDKDNGFAFARFAHKRNNAVIGVVKIDPFESFETVLLLPQRRLAFVNVIEMLDQPAQPIVRR